MQAQRSTADAIAVEELRTLGARWPRLRMHLHTSRDAGRLDAQALAQYVPDWTERETLLCGPDGFMTTFAGMYRAAGLVLQSESFGRRAAPIEPEAPAHAVSSTVGSPGFNARAGQSLLDAAEAAGLKPRFGCRRGICHTCQCQKRSGTVLNLLTGQQSGPGAELIQLCISTPQSALELSL